MLQQQFLLLLRADVHADHDDAGVAALPNPQGFKLVGSARAGRGRKRGLGIA